MHNRPPKKRYYPLWWLLTAISLLPFPVLYLLSDFLYLVLYKGFGYRKKVVWQNLSNSFPEKSEAELKQIMNGFYNGLCDIIVETVKLATIPNDELNRRISISNPVSMQNYLASGTSVLTLGSHLANWEWALPAASKQFSFPQEAVYKPLSNKFFEWYMVKLRTSNGGYLIKMKETLRHLTKNRHMARGITMLADQTPPGGEIQYWTSFMNQDTPFYVGGEKLAAAFKYPVFFFAAHRTKRGYYKYVIEEIYDGISELPAGTYPVTEQYVRKLENWIRKYPSDYLWSHRRWKHKRPVETAS